MAGPNLIQDKICPFCSSKLDGDAIRIIRTSQVAMVQCPVCGPHTITGEGIDAVELWSLSRQARWFWILNRRGREMYIVM